MTEESDAKKLIAAATAARQHAYCRYSEFRVGAAVMTEDRTIIGGCNVENASFPVGICAERTAIVKAVSEGHKSIIACAVIGWSDDPQKVIPDTCLTPCGMCRQALKEFDKDMTIYCAAKDGSYETVTLAELLPRSFASKNLNV